MACELLGAGFIAPYFGKSLYVWTAVLGTTLGGLATGYFLGGRISEKLPYYKTLLIILLCSGFFMGIMPHLSGWIMQT
ncbi:MAG: fused MFS/spermidine synthase, partial [Flavobacteriales bacterium]